MSNINPPTELATLDQWVCWCNVGDKKLPYQPGGRLASTTDPNTWHSLKAVESVRQMFDGIGFVFAPGGGLTGVHIDDCISAGEIQPWTSKILDTLPQTYNEISPSGTGIKLWLHGTMPTDTRHVFKLPTGIIEIYDQQRFFTFTGRKIRQAIPAVAKADISGFISRLATPTNSMPSNQPATESDVIQQGFQPEGAEKLCRDCDFDYLTIRRKIFFC